MKLFTIGFTRSSAERFFDRLERAGVRRVIDVRLHATSQLAGFAKRDDLRYFLRRLGELDYLAPPELAPTEEMLAAYRAKRIDWDEYARRFRDLLESRRIDETIPREIADHGCLLCSEATAHQCHRRLVAEHLAARWGGVQIVHL